MQRLGFALLVLVIIFMIGAFAAAYFRKFPHSSPQESLQLIAHDRTGWMAQAIIFPLMFGGTAVLFLLLAWQLPDGMPHGLGLLAAALFAAGFAFWLPLSIGRIRYWPQAVELLQNYDPNQPVDVNFGGSTFWPHTITVMLAITLMSAALALGGVLPILGWVVAGLTVAGLLVGTLLWHDWPPFLNYLLLLIMAVGLMVN